MTSEEKEALFTQWQQDRTEFPENKAVELDALIEVGEGKSPARVQSEFESFMASLPPNFRTGLSKLVDVENLTPEQLRGMLMANSIDGMDEVIRAAQFGDRSEAGVTLRTGQRLQSEHVPNDETGRLTPTPVGAGAGRGSEPDLP